MKPLLVQLGLLHLPEAPAQVPCTGESPPPRGVDLPSRPLFVAWHLLLLQKPKL